MFLIKTQTILTHAHTLANLTCTTFREENTWDLHFHVSFSHEVKGWRGGEHAHFSREIR